MAIAPIVTRGFGSFGGVNLLPTRGYGIGTVAPSTTPYLTETDTVCFQESRTDTLYFQEARTDTMLFQESRTDVVYAEGEIS